MKKGFDEILLEAVDEGLSSLGESSKQAIYFHLEKSFNIRKPEIPSRVRDFAGAIHGIFGLGADFLEILIMKGIREKIGGGLGRHDSTAPALSEYVILARRVFQESAGSGFAEEPVVFEEAEIEV